MSIESKLATRENETPAQSAFDATVKKPRNGNVENRETDTDSANKEIAKPLETDHIPEQAKKTDGGYSALGIRSNSPQASWGACCSEILKLSKAAQRDDAVGRN